MPVDDEVAQKNGGDEEVLLVQGVFSWSAAWCLMVWVVAFILSVGMGLLTYTGGGIERISEELSFIREQNPPYGPQEQPIAMLGMRDINQPFRYHLPQMPLFFSLASASLGLFMVCLFTTLMLLEVQGSRRCVDISWLVSKGVTVYMNRTLPCICVFLFMAGWYVYVASGFGTLLCFIAGASLNMVSAKVGVNTCVAATARLANAMGEQLETSVTLGMRTGAIGGLLSTSLGLGGLAAMWLVTLDTTALSGFGSGASLVSFYLRVGGGIFSKGAEIGADLVGEMSDNKLDEDRRVYELQQRLSEMESLRADRRRRGLQEEEEDMMDQLRMMEEEMKDIASSLHPIDYLDAVGENICDVSGTCADLFESMVLILSLSLIIGARGSAVPHFFTALPLWIVASGNLACAMVAHRSHVKNRFTSRQVRWYMRLNLAFVIVFVQLVQITVSFLEYSSGGISFEVFWHLTVISIIGTDGEVVKLLRILRLVRTARLIRLLKLKWILEAIDDAFESEMAGIWVKIFKMVLLLLAINHLIACVWFLLASTNPADDTWLVQEGYDTVNWDYQYATAFRWSITQFTPAGMEVQPHNMTERTFTIAVVVFALVGFSYVVGSITGSLAQLRSMSEHAVKEFWRLRLFLKRHKVPPPLALRIKRFVEFEFQRQQKMMPLETVGVLKLLSEQMMSELQAAINIPHMTVHPLFELLRDKSSLVMHRICNTALGHKQLAPGDILFMPGEQASCMYFLTTGRLWYRRLSVEPPNGEEIKDEPRGEWVEADEDWITEPGIWLAEWEHLGSATATRPSSVIKLRSENLYEVIKQCPPSFWRFLKEYATRFCNWLDNTDFEDLSDIFQGDKNSDLIQSFIPQQGEVKPPQKESPTSENFFGNRLRRMSHVFTARADD